MTNFSTLNSTSEHSQKRFPQRGSIKSSITLQDNETSLEPMHKLVSVGIAIQNHSSQLESASNSVAES